MSNIQYQIQNWAKVSEMTSKIITISSKVQDHQYAIRKESIIKQFLKNILEWNLVTKNFKK